MSPAPAGLSLSKPSLFFFEASKNQAGLRQAQASRHWAWVQVLSVLWLALALFASPALAQTFPPLTGRVVDNANLLNPAEEAALSAKLEALEKSTGRQLVVATLPDLQGYEIEDYGYQLGRAWKIGQKGENNGIILIVAPNQRKVRIEVGYGLEPYVTDALSSIIIQQQILPRFKAGDFPGGIEAGVDALISQLQLPEDQAQARQQQIVNEGQKEQRSHRSGGGVPIGLIFCIIVAVFIFSSMWRGRGRRAGPWGARRYGGGSNWPVWLWVASEIAENASRGRRSGWGGGGGGGWGGGGFTGGGGGSFGGGGAGGSW